MHLYVRHWPILPMWKIQPLALLFEPLFNTVMHILSGTELLFSCLSLFLIVLFPICSILWGFFLEPCCWHFSNFNLSMLFCYRMFIWMCLCIWHIEVIFFDVLFMPFAIVLKNKIVSQIVQESNQIKSWIVGLFFVFL